MKKRSFFDSGFFRFLSTIADLIVLNLLFLLCCIPFITIGPALTAMYYVTLRIVRKEEAHIAKDFFHSFRQNLKQGILLHLLASLISIILGFNLYVLWNLMETSWVYKYLLVLICLLFTFHIMTCIYLYPILAQFDNTLRNSLKNARFMALKHFPYTLAMFLLCTAPVLGAVFINYYLEWEIVIFGLIGFSLITYLNARFFVKIFAHYISGDNT